MQGACNSLLLLVGRVLMLGLLLLQVAGLRPAPIRFADEVPEGDTAVVRRDVIMPQKAIAVRTSMPRLLLLTH